MKPLYTPMNDIRQEAPDNLSFANESLFGDFCEDEVLPGIKLSVIDTEADYFSTDFVKENDGVELSFIINGTARCLLDSSHVKPVELHNRTALINCSQHVSGRFEAVSNSNIQMLGIDVEYGVFVSMLQEEGSGVLKLVRSLRSASSSEYIKSDKITAMQSLAIRQLLSCPFYGRSKSIYIQSKVLELISLHASLFSECKKTYDTGFISAGDEDKIRYSRELLKSQMTDPPNLIELSEAVGLSIGKLKRGFKTVYGKPAFRCLHEDRMERAHFLLSERHLNVSEVAWEVGYINVGHFSTAFHNYFGIRPKDFQLSFK